jgi:hypothetical protein
MSPAERRTRAETLGLGWWLVGATSKVGRGRSRLGAGL